MTWCDRFSSKIPLSDNRKGLRLSIDGYGSDPTGWGWDIDSTHTHTDNTYIQPRTTQLLAYEGHHSQTVIDPIPGLYTLSGVCLSSRRKTPTTKPNTPKSTSVHCSAYPTEKRTRASVQRWLSPLKMDSILTCLAACAQLPSDDPTEACRDSHGGNEPKNDERGTDVEGTSTKKLFPPFLDAQQGSPEQVLCVVASRAEPSRGVVCPSVACRVVVGERCAHAPPPAQEKRYVYKYTVAG